MPGSFLTRTFRRTPDGVEARLPEGLAELLRRVCTDLADLLGDVDDRIAAQGPLARLFPDAYHDDVERADELRSLIQDDLRDAKIAAARSVVDSLSDLPANRRVRLDDAVVEHWLTAINDLRLLLGTQLDITDDEVADEEQDDEDEGTRERRYLYQLLTWLQGELVEELID